MGNHNMEVTIGLVQTAVTDNIPENISKTVGLVRKAAEQGAQIICLQELFNTIYFPQYEKYGVERFAEPIPGDTINLFSKLAKELGIVIIVPIFEKALNNKYYNSAVTIGADGSILGVYRKIHIPFDPFFYEKNYFRDGDLGYQVYNILFNRHRLDKGAQFTGWRLAQCMGDCPAGTCHSKRGSCCGCEQGWRGR